MADMPEGKLLFDMAVPLMISMLIQALYNIVDSIYVGLIGENALTAVTLGMPVQNLMISVCVGTGVGVASLLSRRLGEKKYEEGANICGHSLVLSIASYLPFLLFGLFGSEWFIGMFTKDAQILDMGVVYIRICCVYSFGVSIQVMLSRVMQAFGDSVFQMSTQSVGAVLNIILDPIMIFGYFGLHKMGIAGAAYATVISQIISALVGIVLIKVKHTPAPVSLKHFKYSGQIIKDIYQVGLPSIIMQSISSVLSVFLNSILMGMSSTAVAVYGVYNKLQSFVFMPVFGVSNALVAIIGYNYGAKNKKRMMRTFKLAMITSVAIMAVGFALFQFFPKWMLEMFSADANMMKIGIPALRIISFNFVFAAMAITIGSIFSGTGNGVYSMIVSIVRQLVVILPVAYLLSLTGNIDLVWLSFAIAELVGLALSVFFLKRTYESKLQYLGEEENNY